MNVGIFIFDEVEVLDFAGPFEVFAVTLELNNFEFSEVFTFGRYLTPITTVNGLSVTPKYNFKTMPDVDILIIPGGAGIRKQVKTLAALNWINRLHQFTKFTLSICTGSMLLGTLKLLDNKPYCTHHEAYEEMEEIVPTGLPKRGKRFVNSNKIFTSGGISAGIDLSFHIVQKLHGKKVAKKTADYMEYAKGDWSI